MKTMPLPAHPKTGVCPDFWNEFLGLPCIWRPDTTPEENQRSLQEYPPRRYEDRYSCPGWTDVITPRNRESVTRLNEIVDELNGLAYADKFPLGHVEELLKEVRVLIRGKKD